MTDDKILFFIHHTKDLLHYIETGERSPLPFDDLGGDEDGQPHTE